MNDLKEILEFIYKETGKSEGYKALSETIKILEVEDEIN